MMKGENRRYNSKSDRLQDWNYGNNGTYFLTICTKNRINYFGNVKFGKMNLSTAGIKMEEICNMVNDQFDYIHIAEFVIMPNHLHFLMVLNTEEPGFSDVHEQIKTRPLASQHHGSIEQKNEIPVDTMDTIELEMMNALDDQIKINGGFARHKNPMLNNNISCVMRWIKGRSSFEIRKFQPRFSWQARYHDKILFDKRAFQTIRNYIINNPINWHRDKLNKTK